MAESKEARPLKERQTLTYSTPEQAAQWRERVHEKVRAEQGKSVRRPREIVAEAVAEQFLEEGHGVTSLSYPWEHSAAEHAEAQGLVDMAFAHDLTTALRQAKKSPAWPRNLDLFHDVLTTEMYDLLKEHKLNKQPIGGWALFVMGIILVAMLVIGLLLLAAY